VFVPQLTVLSVQADFNNVFHSTFTTEALGGPDSVAGTFELTGGLFNEEIESLSFDANFQGEVPIFVDATPVTTGNPGDSGSPSAVPEPGTFGLILTAFPVAFAMRRQLSALVQRRV
jgi:hypothetical protein